MFCIKCGKELSSESSFCENCGTPVKAAGNAGTISGAPKKRGKMKTLVGVLLFVLVAAGIWFAWTKVSRNQPHYSDGFDTSQEAMDYFVDAVANMNYEKALSAFPIEREAENYDFYANLERNGLWNRNVWMPVPGDSDENIQLNQHFLSAYVERNISNFVFSFFAEPELREGLVLKKDEAEALFENYNVEDIKELKIIEMTFAEEEIQKSDKLQEHSKMVAEIYGGDTLEEYIVTYQIGSNTYIGGVTFIKYGEKYYIWELCSSLAGTDSLGYVVPTEEW